MARNDGIDRTVARNQDIETADDLAKVQEHNEREKDSYSNQDIVPDRSSLNIHFKEPTAGYDRATKLEEIGYSVMTMSPALFRQMNRTELLAA